MPDPSHHDSSLPELLSPAGEQAAAYAALHYGADAIYTGLPRFSARAEATNLDTRELAEITAYAHSLTPPRRVYVTVNTLVQEHEIADLVETLAAVADSDADAVIVQDLGVAAIVRRFFPRLKLHASTQMAIHNSAGVAGIAALGFSRVVLARELGVAEISEIRRSTAIETEIFVHGALCYSYSGLCLFSALLAGRSANRGRCAYPCRGTFREKPGDAGFLPFNMRDLALMKQLPKLRQAGVHSLKIEGRMKGPLYVAVVTNYYRQLLDAKQTPAEMAKLEQDLRTVFNRDWTELYLTDRRPRSVVDREAVGHRGAVVGKVAAVPQAEDGRRVLFKTQTALELHDGLQIWSTGACKPYGFAIQDLRVREDNGKWTKVFTTPANVEVAVGLPEDAPTPPIGAVVYQASSQRVKREYKWQTPKPGLFQVRIPVRFEVTIEPTQAHFSASCELADGVGAINVAHDVSATPELTPARNAEAATAAIDKAFQRLGDTTLTMATLETRNPHGLYLPPSMLNDVRRCLTEKLAQQILAARQRRIESIREALRKSSEPHPVAGDDSAAFAWSLKTDRTDSFDLFTAEDWDGVKEITLMLTLNDRQPSHADTRLFTGAVDTVSALRAVAPERTLRVCLPPVVGEQEIPELTRRCRLLLAGNCRHWEIANLGGWEILRQAAVAEGIDPCQLDISTDWPIYVLNLEAAREVLRLGASAFTLSPEDTRENLNSLIPAFPAQCILTVYQYPPLFISETCTQASPDASCRSRHHCPSVRQALVSDFGNRIELFNRDCRTFAVSAQPLYIPAALQDFSAFRGQLRLRADWRYTAMSGAAIRDSWRSIRNGGPLPDSITGNYHRQSGGRQ